MFEFGQKARKKTDYLVGGDWSELKKAWDRYNAALADQDMAKARERAAKINRIQERMGLKKTDFS